MSERWKTLGPMFDAFLLEQGMSPDDFLEAWAEGVLNDAVACDGDFRTLLDSFATHLQEAAIDWYVSTK